MAVLKGFKMNGKIAIKNLLAHWSVQRYLQIPHGISPQEIELFAKNNKLKIPVDFADYLRSANGFGIGDTESSLASSDDEGFEFYALSKQRIVGPGYSIFCGWPYGFIEYAICMTNSEKNGVVVQLIDDNRGYFLAKGFSDFISLYLENSSRLYAPGTEVVVLKE